MSGTTAPTLGTPQRLFTRPSMGTGFAGWYPTYEVTPDGGRFVIGRGADQKGQFQGVIVVQNWVAEFEGKR